MCVQVPPSGASLHTQDGHSSMTQLPLPSQLSVHPPPAQSSSSEPLPLLVAVHPPCGQEKWHEPLPLQVNEQSGPVHEREHDWFVSHEAHAVPEAHVSGLDEQAAKTKSEQATGKMIEARMRDSLERFSLQPRCHAFSG